MEVESSIQPIFFKLLEFAPTPLVPFRAPFRFFHLSKWSRASGKDSEATSALVAL